MDGRFATEPTQKRVQIIDTQRKQKLAFLSVKFTLCRKNAHDS